MSSWMEAQLIELIGENRFFALAERWGGTRLYVAHQRAGGELVERIGEDGAALLADRYGRNYIKVPLARELRARRYRGAGLSNAEIAVRLGMTESGVERLFRRTPVKIVKAKKKDFRQIDMFPDTLPDETMPAGAGMIETRRRA